MNNIDLSLPATQARFGELVGISQQAVGQLIAEGVLGREAPVAAWLLAYCGRLREQAAGRLGREDVDLAGQRAKLAQRQTEIADLRLARLRGELVRADALHQVLSRWVLVCRERLLNVAPRLTPVVAAAKDEHEAHELIAAEMCEVLRHIAGAPKVIDDLVVAEVAELQGAVR